MPDGLRRTPILGRLIESWNGDDDYRKLKNLLRRQAIVLGIALLLLEGALALVGYEVASNILSETWESLDGFIDGLPKGVVASTYVLLSEGAGLTDIITGPAGKTIRSDW